MRCTTCRTQLHNWFDSQGSAAMPPEVSEHVRDCSDCRTFIKSWNAVELSLQSVRDQAPALSPDFTTTLRARLAREEGRRRIRIPFPALPAANYRRLALATLTAIGIVLAARYSGNVKSMLAPSHATLASATPRPKPADEVKPPISPDLPIANTNSGR